jgi:hypothetical protein
MTKTSVSLLVISRSMSLDELSSKLGRVPSSGSHSKGDAGPRSGPWSETIWRFDSDAQETMPAQNQLERLAVQFSASELKQVLPPGCDVSIDIVLFFNTVNVSATISSRGIEIVDSYNANLEINCYPSTFEADKCA